ncbi:hypothetical protein [Actinoplanes friuliensis]|jgi:hypothetical protein|uniref:Uncharacterized protein n=1 Tax=Actinoplanes friuliensis DSM 7358 TaxID=1246995 RepID=U5WCN0_9ACTN|nr:hypothetical protein [Actinoplanes friuliensis]AGZ45760.1 hypothetical protein AFR_37530 [Actinoplanes friuliensis DSM 7358]
MDVVAQWVRTTWTKKSRGGAEAARRNALPVAFPLPVFRVPLTHQVVMDEGSDFDTGSSVGDTLPEGVQLSEADGRLRVHVTAIAPMPPRSRPPAVRLNPGEWLRWQINYRLVGHCTGEWSYRSDTLNLAYQPRDEFCFTGPPARVIDELAHLR